MVSFGLDVRFGQALAAEVLLNGALLSETRPGYMTSHSLAIQHEVLPGANTLEVVVTAGRVSPNAEPQPAPDVNSDECYVEIELDREYVLDMGDIYKVTSEPVADKSWRPSTRPVFLPHQITLSFEAPLSLQPPIWTRAAPMQAGSVKAGVAAALEQLRELLERRDLEAFQSQMHLRNADMARAYPFSGSAAQRASEDVAALSAELASPGARLTPIDAQGLMIRTFAEGRIIEVRAADGEPPLRIAAPGQPPTILNMSFANIDGRLSVIR